MEVKVIKSQKEAEWKFPCMGISKVNKLVVGFSGYERGVVLDIGNSDIYSIHEVSYVWDMSKFEPIEQIDWDKIIYPVYAENQSGEIIIITSIDYNDYFNADVVKIITMPQLNHDEEKYFFDEEELNEWLNSLKILPKDTKIEITL